MNGSDAFGWFMDNVFSWVALVAVICLSLALAVGVCSLVYMGFTEFLT